MTRPEHGGALVRSAALAVAVGFALEASGGLGCGGDETKAPADPGPPVTAEVQVDVEYPTSGSASAVSSLHLWVLVPGEESKATCAALVGATSDPYDVDVIRLADVASQEVTGKLVAPGVGLGAALAYVEAVDYFGVPELAGCVEIEVVAPETAAMVKLGKAKVSDCGDPSTEDGAACDDGELCTVGEACDGGACVGGVARDCTHLADACSAASCDEQAGCVATALADDTPCEDDLYCTTGDVCADGACVGVERDCETGLGACEVSLGCDEASDQCISDEAPNGALCDDGVFCTEDDECYFGACEGQPRDCSTLTDTCAVGVCDEAMAACVADFLPSGQLCSDGLFCVTNEACDGAGNCVGTPLVCAGGTACTPKSCDEAANTCVNTFAAVGTPCDDVDACTTMDQCNGTGTCAGTALPMCP